MFEVADAGLTAVTWRRDAPESEGLREAEVFRMRVAPDTSLVLDAIDRAGSLGTAIGDDLSPHSGQPASAARE